MAQPGKQSDMKGPDPVDNQVPTEDGGYQTYKAAGKLKDKKAIITGGDSGIGRAIAILYAMEGADSILAYLPEEQEDAEKTKKDVEEHGTKCYLFPTDITKQENCKKLVEEALEKMGAINIVVNNAAYQNMINGIANLSEYVHNLTHHLNPSAPSNMRIQRTMDQNLRHQHPPLLLPLQIRPRAHEIRRHHHKLRLRERLHRPPRPPRLHLQQRRHRLLHPRPAQPADRARHPRQRRLPGPRLDASHSLHDEGVRAGSVQCDADGQAGPAVGDCDVFRVPG